MCITHKVYVTDFQEKWLKFIKLIVRHLLEDTLLIGRFLSLQLKQVQKIH